MSKDAPKGDKREDEDYEVVSFEDFCDKPAGSKTDLLTLNDNINYRLCFESDRGGKSDGESSRQIEDDHETSLNDNKTVTWRKKATTFAPFGKYDPKPRRASLLGGVIPKQKTEEEGSSDQRYQRFSTQKSWYERLCSNLPGLGSTILVLLLITALAVGVWWAVCGALGGAWGEEHYRRLWERAHPYEARPRAPSPPVAPAEKLLPEYRYHDHNNLSTKNKNNVTERKKELNKKSFNLTAPAPAECSRLVTQDRHDCHPQDGATEELCTQRGCCWNNKTALTAEPACYYPGGYNNYRFLNLTETRRGLLAYYERVRASGYPDEFDTVRMDVNYFDNNIVQIKITDPTTKRFEPPYPQIPVCGSDIANMSYRVVVDNGGFGVKVIRTKNAKHVNVTIFDTKDSGGIILADKFLQFTASLPHQSILYGLGEHRSRFKLDTEWRTYTMFNRDTVPARDINLYGSHPFLMSSDPQDASLGIFLHNSNAMDVVLTPSSAATFRATGGVLDFYIMLGPSPLDVVAQYYSLVGYPFMPPYWALGFHLCKFNYGSLNVTESVWQRNRDAGVPLDVQWNDLDYMENGNDFTYDKKNFAGLPQFVDKLHKNNYHYMVLIDPGVSGSEPRGSYAPYDRAVQLDVLIKNSSSQPFVGKVWNKHSTVFPDFTHPNATAYWLEMMQSLHKQIAYDGAWIDMNEPSNFVSGSVFGQCEPEDLPYVPKTIGPDGLKTKTLCMEARHYAGPHVHFHNLHAYTEAVATHFALAEIRGKRPFVISRATCPGMGQLAGHWAGDVLSDWEDMRMSLPQLMNFNMFGFPMMGSDICGFRGNTTEELCKRWMQLGAFYPFARNHNSDTSIPQDPASFSKATLALMIQALRLRYSLLPYYYTQFFRAHVYGDMLVRPIFFQYPTEYSSHSLQEDVFMVGPSLLVAPVLRAARTGRVLLPGRAPWAALQTGRLVAHGYNYFKEDSTVLLAPGGIIPSQIVPETGPITTHVVRAMPLQLRAVVGERLTARGELYWDDGDSMNSYSEKKYSHIKFEIDKERLRSEVVWWGHGIPQLTDLLLWNLGDSVRYVYVDGQRCSTEKPHTCHFNFNYQTRLLHIYDVTLDLQKPLNISWGAFNDTEYAAKFKVKNSLLDDD